MMTNDKIKTIALATLTELVTSEGIFASTSKGMQGVYHGFFGRDTIVTAALIFEAEMLSGKPLLLAKAVQAVINLSTWQGKNYNHENGEEFGKIPHEVRVHPIDYVHLTRTLLDKGQKSWYVDVDDAVMKNWDSNDSTPMWVIATCRFIEAGLVAPEPEILIKIKNALQWCMHNTKEHGGLGGFSYNVDRRWGGLQNQTWKDSERAYLTSEGESCYLPQHPIKDVWVSGLMWSALKYGQKLFSEVDDRFSKIVEEEAYVLKKRFNSSEEGFLVRDEKSLVYFAEAIDGTGKQLKSVSCDPALNLWSFFGQECVIDDIYLPAVTERISNPDMFDPGAGVRVYSVANICFDPLEYHRGPNTFWPFTTALIASGLNHFGQQEQAIQVLEAMLIGVKQFGTCVELMIKDGKNYRVYRDPLSGQLSASDQAWTAAAVYYAVNYLEKYQVQVQPVQVEATRVMV